MSEALDMLRRQVAQLQAQCGMMESRLRQVKQYEGVFDQSPSILSAVACKTITSLGLVTISGVYFDLVNQAISSVPTATPASITSGGLGLNVSRLGRDATSGPLVWVAFRIVVNGVTYDASYKGHIPSTVFFEAEGFSIPCDAGGTSIIYLPKLALW